MSPVPEDVVWALPGETGSHATSLLVLPHAGGSAHTYAQWRDLLPGSVRLLIGQYPGRGARFTESLPESLDDLAGPILRCLPADATDLVILGHSMGSLVAFEIARALTLEGRPPLAFVASACRAPHLPNPCPVRPEQLTDDGLVAAIKARGGTEDGILDEPELREIVLPPIRADFGIDDAYQFTGDVTALTCPATIVGGDADPVVPVETLSNWRKVTHGPSEVHVLPGGHFYFQQEIAAFMSIVHSVIDSATTTRHQFA